MWQPYLRIRVSLAEWKPTTGTFTPAPRSQPNADVCLPQAIELRSFEVVEVATITVVEGPPLPAGTEVTPPSSTRPVPVPTIREEC